MSAPQLIFLAGPNGAGKTTYYRTFLRPSGLPFVNADELASRLDLPFPAVVEFTDGAREVYLESRESFITETVFSDPVGAKLGFLRRAMEAGYEVQLHFVGISSPMLSEARVSQRVAQGGHDVPTDRLERRFRQSLLNLGAALEFVPEVRVFDNSSTQDPYRLVLRKDKSGIIFQADPLPSWLAIMPR